MRGINMREITLENGKVVKISAESYNELSKAMVDTREDCSDICYWDKFIGSIGYINPNNDMQIMFVDNYGFNLESCTKHINGKDRGQKLVWQKVESINKLKKGDLIRFWDDYEDKNNIGCKGIITAIKNDNMCYQLWGDMLTPVTSKCTHLDNWENVEKVVLVEE